MASQTETHLAPGSLLHMPRAAHQVQERGAARDLRGIVYPRLILSYAAFGVFGAIFVFIIRNHLERDPEKRKLPCEAEQMCKTLLRGWSYGVAHTCISYLAV